MTVPAGGFGSAEDADSLISKDSPDHGEGAFYVWTQEEIGRAVGVPRAALFDYFYGIEPSGNTPGGAKGDLAGKNILAERHTYAETARKFGLGEAEAARALEESRSLLRAASGLRPRPRLDDKVLTSWNGLMISAFARGYQVLGDPAYLESARRAAAFIEGSMYRNGTLMRSYRDGPATIEGFGDDYAFLVQGLLDLYEASFDVHWIEWARSLQARQDELFWDTAEGGYFGTTGKDAHVLLRMKEGHDGAEPSMNSVATLNLLRLGSLFDDNSSRERAIKTIQAFAGHIQRSPASFPQMLVGVDWLRRPSLQIVIAGRPGTVDTLALLAELNRTYIPTKIVIMADGGPGQKYFRGDIGFFPRPPRRCANPGPGLCLPELHVPASHQRPR